MQLACGMHIDKAKAYVAEKLGVNTFDLSDPGIMTEVRTKYGIGTQQPLDRAPAGIAAKMRIEKVLDIEINSVKQFKKRAGIE